MKLSPVIISINPLDIWNVVKKLNQQKRIRFYFTHATWYESGQLGNTIFVFTTKVHCMGIVLKLHFYIALDFSFLQKWTDSGQILTLIDLKLTLPES